MNNQMNPYRNAVNNDTHSPEELRKMQEKLITDGVALACSNPLQAVEYFTDLQTYMTNLAGLQFAIGIRQVLLRLDELSERNIHEVKKYLSEQIEVSEQNHRILEENCKIMHAKIFK